MRVAVEYSTGVMMNIQQGGGVWGRRPSRANPPAVADADADLAVHGRSVTSQDTN